ncbi:cobalamin-dependent protein [Anaerotalea alkaliphila]|uniref:Cobalamin-binding protein n=1 Tax=Anaerotalea alkaliphila TaxID=2662126 RepID=A0A7X5KPQ4_9FIRM|nr:cobalamin-binding protein [Anaerotalea alkaliphila]
MNILNDISSELQQGCSPKVRSCVQQALDEGVLASEILEKGLLDGMSIVGRKFKNNEVFVPEVLIAARAMAMGTELLRPQLGADGAEKKGTVIIGTVKGDVHDIGKNIVRMMMEGKGLEVVDLGVDVSAEKFIEKAREHEAQMIACSALLTTTMREMRSVVKAVEASEMKGKVKIMVGGAPITRSFCEQIGAHCFAQDAASAADAAFEMCAINAQEGTDPKCAVMGLVPCRDHCYNEHRKIYPVKTHTSIGIPSGCLCFLSFTVLSLRP